MPYSASYSGRPKILINKLSPGPNKYSLPNKYVEFEKLLSKSEELFLANIRLRFYSVNSLKYLINKY